MVKKTFFEKIPWWIIIIVLALALAVYLNPSNSFTSLDEVDPVNTDWQDNYASLAREQDVGSSAYTGSSSAVSLGASELEKYTSDTPYYDINNFLIVSAANKIASESKSSLEAIEKTVAYVYDNTGYVYGEADSACMDGTAPAILTSGNGQCDTQSIVTISILRQMGIAARPVGGCVYQNPDALLQSFLLHSFTSLEKPLVGSSVADEEGVVSLSRGMASGGLHAWSVAWVPGSGWVPIESTSGQLANTELYNYHVELFPEDDSKSDICVSKNRAYAEACYNNDLPGLNREGLGLMQEVVVR